MRPVRIAALALAAAVPLSLSTRAEEPARSPSKDAPPAATESGAGAGAVPATAHPSGDAAKDFFAPKRSGAADARSRSATAPAADDDGDASPEVVRGAGRCGG